ncbi:MAG TPA: glycosyltransferase family 2 protein [Candidatus Microsaccharimonas sp.]|jgi:cellulose synthase/poly-beta-1,6-N-acetylglucosamine synthase-like glycosyltransferase
MKKTPTLYIIIIVSWLALIGLSTGPFLQAVRSSENHGTLVMVLVSLSTLFIVYFWLNGTKDVIYTAYYHLNRKKFPIPPPGEWRKKNGNVASKKIVAIYCTYNDFNAASLEGCMHQDYPNTKFVILDDSTQDAYKQEVDAFAKKHDIEVVRRKDKSGFKAGNMNNYLQSDTDYDYFIILDSDEVIPPEFTTRSLDYFAFYENAGIVQANHVATRNRNKFMKLFAIGVDSHWPTYQVVKHRHGFLSLLGHGAMISRECYEAAGGFPHLVAEDLCMSIEARNKGFYAAFAPDITCEEEYPISYLAFKKRHSKWTQGNMEFIKKYSWRIFRSKMTWFEKLDIVLFTYSLPLSAFFALYIIINVIFLPVLHYTTSYPVWLLIPTLLFLIAPMLNDVLYYARTIRPHKLLWYLAHTVLLYGSMLYTSLYSSITSTFGKAVFLVTPKEHTRLSKMDAFISSRGELLFGAGVLGVAYTFNHTVLSTIVIAVPALFSVYLALMANKQ